jgi:hypothetical protein
MAMPKVFIKNEKWYLLWAAKNPNGFIVNADAPPTSPDYPMVHRATHKAMTSHKRQNYTTGRYFKVCSNDMSELEKWAKEKRDRPLNPCGICM